LAGQAGWWGGGAVGQRGAGGYEAARWQLRQGRAAQAGQAQTCSKPVCMECTFLERSLKSSNEVHNVLAAYIRYIELQMPHHVQGLALTLEKTTLLNKTCDQNFCSGCQGCLFWITALTIQHRAPCPRLCTLKLAIGTHHLAMEQHCLQYRVQETW